jgi:hypothetical protein
MQHEQGLPAVSQTTSSGPPDSNDFSSSTTSQAGRKRKAGSTGPRGVASLTPDQLAKKRANDREAQRAIRERTKHTIENLERRIQELTSQQPYQELQEVIRQKDAVQAENEEIRRRLASVMALIQPIIGAQGLTGSASSCLDYHRMLTPTSNRSCDSCAEQSSPNLCRDHGHRLFNPISRGIPKWTDRLSHAYRHAARANGNTGIPARLFNRGYR